MQHRSSKLLITLIIAMLAILVITGCGKSGTRFDNQNPTIRITSYEGFDGSTTYSSQDTLTFQQRVYWHASDPDGVIQGYAFRILNNQGVPVSTPGYRFIDADGSITPTNLQNSLGNGWVIHYLPGADQAVPLDDPQAKRSIWTSQKFAIINFPSADANGNPLPSQHRFEVIAIDNRGGITQIPAFRLFNTSSLRPTCTVNTTKGNPNGAAVGSGLKLSFTMKDLNPFVSDTPWYYEFKVQKLSMTDAVLEETEWYRTDRPGNPKLNEYMLTRDTDPALSYDFNAAGTTQISKTRIVGRVYNLSGVMSDVNTLSSNLLCAVKPGFKPKAFMYDPKIHAIGDNHYLDYTYEDQKTPAEVMPFAVSGGKVKYAIPMFKDLNNKNTAVNSNNFKIWIRWGWLGEYGIIDNSGNIRYPGTPYDKKVDTVLDANLPPSSAANYYSEITHFDLRYNDAPYNFPPYANSIQVDNNGTRWLRIPVNSVLGQGIVLTNLPSGHHELTVRVVDLQNVPSDPVSYEFELMDPIAPANRSGILIIDDDNHHASLSPEPLVTEFYNAILSGYSGVKDIIRLPTIENGGNTYKDRRDRRLAYSDLNRYKLVIYHTDRPQENGTIADDCDGLLIYLQNGGNLLISGTASLSGGIVGEMVSRNQQTLLSTLGINYSPQAVLPAGNLTTNTFFQKAIGQSGFGDINLKFGSDSNASFNPQINSRQGLGAIAYFNPALITATPIFGYGCKPTDWPVQPPTQDQYNTFNNRIVGIRNINGLGRAYTLGFPLSYMVQADAQAFMNRVLSECGL